MRILCFLGCCSLLSPGLLGQKNPGLSVMYEWKQLDFTYPTEEARQDDIASGEYIPGNCVPMDMDVYYGSNNVTRIFVTVPRLSTGVAATLNVLSNDTTGEGPRLMPYPSWDWHRNLSDCKPNRLVSVFRTKIDECGRIWVLDAGRIGVNEQLCPPQVIAFDPETDEVLYRYEIPSEDIVASSLLITPAVDVRDPQNGCRDTFVYAADPLGFGLIVVDVTRNSSWRFSNKLFYPFPDAGTFTIAGESFDLMAGVFGLSLTPLQPGQDRILYFNSLASRTENHVNTSVLLNESLSDEKSERVLSLFEVFTKRRDTQSAASAMDKYGILYFGMLGDISMGCWNSATEYDEWNIGIVDRNQQTLQFPSGVKVITNREGEEELWVNTNRYQKVMTGSMSPNEINFRILSARTEDLLHGTNCKPKTHSVTRPQASWRGIFSSSSYRPSYA